MSERGALELTGSVYSTGSSRKGKTGVWLLGRIGGGRGKGRRREKKGRNGGILREGSGRNK